MAGPAKHTILVTGGRAPAALELVRLFHQAGYRVVMAESLKWHLSRHSRAIAKNYHVPWPNRSPLQYLEALAKIIESERVELIVPTCEEIYFIRQHQDRLPRGCRVFAPDWELLHAMHSKWEFVQRAERHRLLTPQTTLLESAEAVQEVLALGQEVVLKPVYSRFARLTVVRPKGAADVAKVQPSPEHPWVAQQFIQGKQLSTFSIAYQGRLVAHCAYPMNFTTGIGPTYAFTPIEHPAAFAWVEKLVADENYTGQIALDFIEQEDGLLYAIECNPRSTSGLHLFRGQAELAHLFVRPEEHSGPPLTPRSSRPAHLALPLFLWALAYVRSFREAKRWARTFFTGRDVLISLRDPLPLFMLSFNLAPVFFRARRHSINLDEAATMDIEWNGVKSDK